MNTTQTDDLFDKSVSLGIRELDGLESPPDVVDRVLAGTPSGTRSHRPATSALAAILVVALGLATAIAVWFNSDESEDVAPAAPFQDPLPELPAPVTLRSGKAVTAHPVTTEHVLCHDFTREDVRALQRFAGLRGVILRGRDFDRSGIEELARLDKLEQVVIQSELDAEHGPLLKSLSSLPRLRVLALTFGQIDDRVLRAVAVSPKLTALAFRGNIECSAAGMRQLGKDLPKLRHFSVEALRDPPGGDGDEIWESLPATLVELKLNQQAISSKALRRLPGLKKLDLFGSYSVGAELLQHVSTWPGCKIIAPSGAHLVVDAKGRCEPQPRKVVLIQRKDNGAYKAAGYSFRHLSGDVADHGNYVDLLYDGCGLLHTNVFGGSKNRILDLGEDGAIPTLDELPKSGWYADSFRPTVGHNYLHEVRGTGAAKMYVHFRVVKAEGGRVWLEWNHCEAAQVFQLGAPERRGRAGTKGQCGGVHKGR